MLDQASEPGLAPSSDSVRASETEFLDSWSSTIGDSTVPLATASTGLTAVSRTVAFWVSSQVGVPAEKGWGMPQVTPGPALQGAYLVSGELAFRIALHILDLLIIYLTQ
jgi:hypothetical protein